MRFRWYWVLASVFLLCAVFSFYLYESYRQLDGAFGQNEQFVPTRIYSDVTRIAAPQTRRFVQSRLQALAYKIHPGAKGSEDVLSFTLNPIEYPAYLLPDGHPTAEAGGKRITLKFSGPGNDAMIQNVLIADAEVNEIFLEPELVATMARGEREIRRVLKFDEIPVLIKKAIIAVEDQHFLEHSGLDPRGLFRALWVNLRTGSLAQGGSTITAQLVKNLLARRDKNILRKLNELVLSLLLEARYSKELILERYLNEVYLGQVGSLEVHGVAEGAQYFFGKQLKELNLGEVALMAGLIRGPGFYSPYRYRARAVERQRHVLKKMVETGLIAASEAQAALGEPLRFAPPQNSANKAPFFTDFVKAELLRQLKGKMNEQEVAIAGFRVYTTLDMAHNAAAKQAVSDGLVGKVGLEGALASVESDTGYIRALIGGKNYAESNFNRILNMKRQVGSTFKPIVFLTAFNKGVDSSGVPYGPARPIEDAPWKLIYDNGRQSWSPKNYEKNFAGWISLRTALAHSVNTAAARLVSDVGLEQVIATARALGIDSDLPPVPSLSLGVAELSPVELLRAYATIANHGLRDELTVIRAIHQNDGSFFARFIYNPKQVFPAGPSDLLADTLRSVFTDGTARNAAQLGFAYPAAGKTGTTNNHRDSWFAGFTPKFTAVVWVGFDQELEGGRVSNLKLTGSNSALPIWAKYMKEVSAQSPKMEFAQSQHLKTVRIDKRSGRPALAGCPEEQTVLDNYLVDLDLGSAGCEAAWPPSVREFPSK